jgi:serine protease Do
MAVEEMKMGIGIDLVKFFAITNAHPYKGEQFAPRSLGEFVRSRKEFYPNLWQIVQRLEHAGYLWNVGTSNEHDLPQPWFNRLYFSNLMANNDLDYGIMDFIAFGFPEVHRRFRESVVALHVSKVNGEPDTGTGFLLENRCIVTALHCIQNMQEVRMDGWNAAHIPLTHIWTFRDERIFPGSQGDKRPDLAILHFADDPFPDIPGFKLQEAQLLDDVLTMGYPHIPGFPPVLIAETAHIAASLKSTVGKVVAQEQSYLDNQPYLLISARVKGGNSGGPVIDREGKVVGIVAQLSAEAEDRLDILGYGVVTPATTLQRLLDNCTNPDLAEAYPFTCIDVGFKTIR